MNLKDINFSNKINYRFRSEYRITLYAKNERSLKVGFNKKEKALEVLDFLEQLVKTDPKYIDVKMVHKPRVKGNRSFSHMKKNIKAYEACPDLVKLFEPIFNQE
jgi:hypothetical protein